ncbi:penicillin-binding protein 2 [Motiliproteus sp. SC1-56]|uniref:peptidoglycan D,D-transpeptidase FtsI family protein n=1 Tax=Motiliproteus sp. SC1-56 TaxID=2799565 RepID=UPI001A8FECC2|nr:penicillin-binding transpeptidase domain-containing protein [Motiliproteus sp. SC1-56]
MPVYTWRFRLVLLVLVALTGVVVARILYLHLLDDEFLQGQGDARSLRVSSIPAHRGMILDRNGEPLAVSAPVESIWVDPRDFDPAQPGVDKLAALLEMPYAKIRRLVEANRGKRFLYLQRHLTPQEARRVLSLDLEGLYSESDYKRYYPAAEVATHLVGFTNIDGEGQEGLELAFNDWLRGEPGRKRVLRDRLGRTIKDIQLLSEARPGQELHLSIDLRVQYLAYRELKAAVQQHKAKSGSAVVLDVQTGEVLAMVNQPSYNPNDRSRLKVAHLRNRATTDTFEPGSTVKPLTVAAALASGKYNPASQVDTRPGYIRVKNRTIRDHRNYGVLDVTHIITKSSNVGATKLALSIDAGAVRNMFYNAGLGQATGIGFPGERVGTLPHYSARRVVERAAMSYGYGLAVTPLQLAQAYLSIASGGLKRPLSLLRLDEPEPAERIMPEHVARQVLTMMETVTHQGGTGRRAQVPAFRVAGKTGTVHKVGSEGYEDDQYIAVFAGVAPVADPRYVAVVMIDEPQGQEYYGGEVAAPVFSRVMAGTLRLMNVAPDKLPQPLEQQLARN